jgi:hypothetical protein
VIDHLIRFFAVALSLWIVFLWILHSRKLIADTFTILLFPFSIPGWFLLRKFYVEVAKELDSPSIKPKTSEAVTRRKIATTINGPETRAELTLAPGLLHMWMPLLVQR